MPRLTIAQTNFTAGEISPRLIGRTDIDRYGNGVAGLTNVIPVVHGGAMRRPGTLYVAGAKYNATTSRLIPFVVDQGEAYIIELAALFARIYTAGGTFVTELFTTFLVSDLPSVDYVQSATVMIFTHPDHAPQRLRLLESGDWVWDDAPFIVPPIVERGQYMEDGTGFLTLGSAGVGTTTCTALASYFVQSDVGRKMIGGAGEATITGFTSDTVVSVSVTAAFASTTLPAFTLIDQSPQCILKPSAVGVVGGQIVVTAAPCLNATITLSATSGAITIAASTGVFVAGDVGKTIYADTGAVTISGFTSAVQVNGTTSAAFGTTSYSFKRWGITRPGFRAETGRNFIRVNGGLLEVGLFSSIGVSYFANVLQAPTSTDAALPGAWEFLQEAWTDHAGYPRTVTLHEQRLIFGGSSLYPQTIWGSVTGIPLDFTPGTNDDDGFEFQIASDDSNQIQFVTSGRALVIYTAGGEYSAQGGVEKPITPTNIRIRPESSHGCAVVRPVSVGKETVFVQRGGRKVRALGYQYSVDGYVASDLTLLAEHITDSGVVALAYQHEPNQTLMAILTDGTLLTCTFDRDQSVIAWAKHYTDGAFESIAAVPLGDRETAWVVVRRRVNGVTVRYLERFDDTFAPFYPEEAPANTFPPYAAASVYGVTADCASVVDNVSGQTTFTGLGRLEAKSVSVLADGAVMPAATVTGGSITLTRASYRTLIGLPFTSTIVQLTPEVGTGTGTAQGNAMRTSEVTLRLLNTAGVKVLDDEGTEQLLPSRQFGPAILDAAPGTETGNSRVELLGWNLGSSKVSIVQDQPLPMHVLAIIRKFTVND